MDRVFPWDAVLKRHVPKHIEDYPQLCVALHKKVKDKPAIRNVLVYGDVLDLQVDGSVRQEKDASIRSCLQVFYQYGKNCGMEAKEIMDEFVRDTKRYNIQIEFTPCSIEASGTTNHPFGPLLIQRFKRAARRGGIMKGHLPSLQPSTKPEYEVGGYLLATINFLKKSWAEIGTIKEEERVIEVLERALGSPLYAARGLLGLKEVYLPKDSKSVVVEIYKKEFPFFAEQLETLIRIDRRYTTALESQLKHPNESQYRELLRSLTDEIPLTLEFLDANLGYLARR